MMVKMLAYYHSFELAGWLEDFKPYAHKLLSKSEVAKRERTFTSPRRRRAARKT